MKNLSLLKTESTTCPKAFIKTTAFDLDNNVLYVISERQNLDADLDIDIWRVNLDSSNEMEQTVGRRPQPSLVTTFSAMPSAVTTSSQVSSCRVLLDTNRLVLVMKGGDIAALSLDDEDSQVGIEGRIDSGVLCASWSPDDSLLVLVTGDEKLILMTSTFDVLSETSMNTDGFGEDAPINVGWGSKQTQFHGSLGKSAAVAPDISSAAVKNIGLSPDDDEIPRISWRGDGAYFVVSTLTSNVSSPFLSSASSKHRVLRIYDRQAILQSTSEPLAGLEHPCVWRPSGNLIVGTQRFGSGLGAGKEGRHDVVFFEKNGLRHGEFGLREGKQGVLDIKTEGWEYRVRELNWSSDSNVLSVWIEGREGDVVQLWTTGNYHWYLKHEIQAPKDETSKEEPGRFTSISWHQENPLDLILTTQTQIIRRYFIWETFASIREGPNDTGSVAVVDGCKILLTSLRTQNIPPPMSSYQLSVPSKRSQTLRTPIHASFSSSSAEEFLGVVWETGYVEVWNLHTRIETGRGKVMDPVLVWSYDFRSSEAVPTKGEESSGSGQQELRCRQIVIRSGGAGSEGEDNTVPRDVYIDILGSWDGSRDAILTAKAGKYESSESKHWITPMLQGNGRLIYSDLNVYWQTRHGQAFLVETATKTVSAFATWPEFCFLATCVQLLESDFDSTPAGYNSLHIGLSSSAKLYVSGRVGTSLMVASNVTSFVTVSGFLIYTTLAHAAHFAPLTTLAELLKLREKSDGGAAAPIPDWETRRVERGSRIVTVVPSMMALVLQMPRGNLETINPRPLVMKVIESGIDSCQYRKAFFACRKHRIDLNIIVKHDEKQFLNHLTTFVDQVHEVDHINLFLTSLGQRNYEAESISALCDAVRAELEKKDITKYMTSILTAYMVKSPADSESALTLLLYLREDEPQLVEDAVKYIIFLADANSLFNTALGMYDFSLVLMIAQHAQKDPREYLPFLRELRALPKYMQRYRIDNHLGRHTKALKNLSLAGADHFKDCISYVEQHQLYEDALAIWKNSDHHKSVLDVYGDWLFDRRDFKQAALVFVMAGRPQKVMVAYEKALQWQELFELALASKIPVEEILLMAYRVSEDLSSKKRYAEAARVLLDYAKNTRQGVIALVQGNLFSEARRITTMCTAPELIEDIIHPGASESRAQLVEEIHEMDQQLTKQINRLRELRVKKVEEPDAFYGVEDSNLHNVDVMTGVSMAPTTFTRYTVAPTATSKNSKRSSRSKRKLERKVGSGRKGTVDEEEYLLKSLTKLVARLNVTQVECGNLLPHLLNFTKQHQEEGLALQDALSKLEQDLKDALEEVWKKPDSSDEETKTDSWASRMQEKEQQRLTNPIDRVEKPVVNGDDWRVNLFHL